MKKKTTKTKAKPKTSRTREQIRAQRDVKDASRAARFLKLAARIKGVTRAQAEKALGMTGSHYDWMCLRDAVADKVQSNFKGRHSAYFLKDVVEKEKSALGAMSAWAKSVTENPPTQASNPKVFVGERVANTLVRPEPTQAEKDMAPKMPTADEVAQSLGLPPGSVKLEPPPVEWGLPTPAEVQRKRAEQEEEVVRGEGGAA